MAPKSPRDPRKVTVYGSRRRTFPLPRRALLVGGIAGGVAVLVLLATPLLRPESVSPPAVEVQTPAAVQAETTPSTASAQPTASTPDAYALALERIEVAQTLTDLAMSKDDWNLVASRWMQVVELLQTVPEDHENYPATLERLTTAETALKYAQQGQATPPDTFAEAVRVAIQASELTQSAQLPSSWQAVAETWEQAVELMRAVPAESPNRKTAEQKVEEYSQNLAYAQTMVTSSAPTPVATIATLPVEVPSPTPSPSLPTPTAAPAPTPAPPRPTTASSPTAQRSTTPAPQPAREPARAPRTGSCDCPYDRASNGSRCGRRSAYYRPGGGSPVCYL